MVSRLPDLNRPCCQVALSLVHNALGIRHDGIVDENVEMILRSQQRADVAMQRKIGLPGALDGSRSTPDQRHAPDLAPGDTSFAARKASV